MNPNKILAKEYYDHLRAGNIIVLTATPMNKPVKPISIAFDLKHLYDHTMLPQGSWIADKPIVDLAPGTPPEEIVRTCVETVMKMADQINAVVRMDFEMVVLKKEADN